MVAHLRAHHLALQSLQSLHHLPLCTIIFVESKTQRRDTIKLVGVNAVVLNAETTVQIEQTVLFE